MTTTPEFFTVGYGRWPAPVRWARLVEALKGAAVDLLIDTRHSPCSANLEPAHHYGPRQWHVRAAEVYPDAADPPLRAEERGIKAGLRAEGIDYLWLVELGNPQKHDPAMRVFFDHLRDRDGGWPVHRGLNILRRLVREEARRVCLLCACKDFRTCHRCFIAESLIDALGGQAKHRDLSS